MSMDIIEFIIFEKRVEITCINIVMLYSSIGDLSTAAWWVRSVGFSAPGRRHGCTAYRGALQSGG